MKKYKSTIPELSLIKNKSDFIKVKITESKDIYEYVKPFFKDSIPIYESMFMITLNRRLNTTGWVMISRGGRGGTVADIAIIAKYAIDMLASSIVIVHNHPSGSTLPSPEDKELTKRIHRGLHLFEIRFTDHLIITEEDYFSFADQGLL